MVGLIDTTSLQASDLLFSVIHQKVELDIEILSRSLRGRTELTVNPFSKDLKAIRLNCRQCDLEKVTVNGKLSPTPSYQDPYTRLVLPWKAGVNQHHMLRRKLEGQFKHPPERELLIAFPKNIRIDEIDPYSTEAINPTDPRDVAGIKKSFSDGNALDITQGPRSGLEQTIRYNPIIVAIEYTIKDIKDGMHFVGWEEGDLRYPHAYSKNSGLPGTACCLFPCVDDLTSRPTWEISIKCAKSIGDALNAFQPSNPLAQMNGGNGLPSGPNGTKGGLDNSARQHSFTDEDKALDLVVICTGDVTDELVDPQDSAKKTTSFSSNVPVAPQHVGFAIGPFEHVDLTEFRESDEDDKLGQNAVPVHGFCLPGRVGETKNTCLPLAKAMDFFSLTYGSYPFSNYKVCFVDDLSSDIIDIGSLSICSNRILFPDDIIEPLDRVTRQLVHALASQWMGINIVPKEPADMWVVVGISYFMTDVFMKKLCGNNDFRFRQKQASDRIVELDVARPSLYDTGAIVSLDPLELDFMELKAPLVLFILDRRLTKASGSSGLSRIISRIFLNAKVGDLASSAVYTAYFMKTCEKLGHAKLDVFFAQWIYGAGCPRFRVTQRFNKKKLVVEMLIQQVQTETVERDLEIDGFMRDVKEDIQSVFAGQAQPVFTGPMTIRIHEADGTPYEHIIEIKEASTKFDIPYNTKYKRLKRSRRQKERIAVTATTEFPADGSEDTLLYCLGDVLQSEEEMRDWRLSDWSREDEESMSTESYEWIRMDADFEWICKMTIMMPGYMYLSQLQQDRDVVAQYESVQFMATQREHPLISTILVRTLMDRRYFHGIRTAAAAALAKHAKDELDWIGLYHLERVFQELFCFPDSPMTRSNDFSDRTTYYIQCAIPQAIAKVRDNSGKAPLRTRTFLYDKLRFNDNSNNEFSDSYYLAALMDALAEAISSKPAPSAGPFEIDLDEQEDEEDDLRFHHACLDQIDRYRRIDEWIPSYHNILSTTALNCKRKMIAAGAMHLRPLDFLQYTRDGTSDDLRLTAFRNLMDLGLIKNDAVFRWFLTALGMDPSPYIRDRMLRLLNRSLGAIAIGESGIPSPLTLAQQDNLIIEQESSTEARKADLARKQTVEGALKALKLEMSENEVLRMGLWDAITSPVFTLKEVGELLQICELLYEAESSMTVVLKYPRYWQCTKVGKKSSKQHLLTLYHQATLRFSPTGRIRTSRKMPLPLRHTLQPEPPAPAPAAALPKIKLQFQPPKPKADANGSSLPSASGPNQSLPAPSVPRRILKPPKKPVVANGPGVGVNSGSGDRLTQKAENVDGREKEVAAKPKLTLKLSLKGAGRTKQ